jgi:oligoendopeptidase F
MRRYVSADFKCDSWEKVEKYLSELEERTFSDKLGYLQWLKDKSELEAVLEEDMAWRYIRMTIDTTDEEKTKAYQFFVTKIQPKLAPFEDRLNRKMMSAQWVSELESDPAYAIYFRAVQTALDLFREENIPLETEINTLSQEYGAISGKQTITYEGKTLTMPQASVYLKNPDEQIRRAVYDLIVQRREEDRKALDELFTNLVRLRHRVAVNAGCENYRDYKFRSLGRFDYTVQDCLDFHESIEKLIVPIIKELNVEQARLLGKEKLRPWDTEVDPQGKEPLKPFTDGKELLAGAVAMFTKLDPYFGECLSIMDREGYLDLDSKHGKAPGGYNYPLYESGIPFIFMNAAGAQRDLVTMVHEGGHAVHSFLSRDLELTGFKSLPSEVAELASMSMELITMQEWSHFYASEDDHRRARKEQLESILKVLPWIATIDAFQHWIYTHPEHTSEERTEQWLGLGKRFGTGMIDYSGYEGVRESGWQRQLHLYEVPFYYIEYGIAQLGALGVWRNFRENKEKAIEQYKNALKLGYTKSIPAIYETAGLRFDFSKENVGQLAEMLREELHQLS